VTRAKFNFKVRRVYSTKVERATGMVCDQTRALNGYQRARGDPGHLRRVRFKNSTSSYCAAQRLIAAPAQMVELQSISIDHTPIDTEF